MSRLAWNRLYESWDKRDMTHQVPDAVVGAVVEKMGRGQEAAMRAAEVSCGWYEFLETPAQAAGVYERILADINHRYVLGYYPTDKEPSGRARKVRIEVRNHPEYVVHGRDSYRLY